MQDLMTDALAILVACLVIAALATLLVIFRPSARRRRRHNRRRSSRSRIDLFKPVHADSEAKSVHKT
jgi:hypothetical protein